MWSLAGATAARAGDDLVTWRPGNGTWYTLAASTNYSPAAATAKQWGNLAAGDVPMMGDIDGDGIHDLDPVARLDRHVVLAHLVDGLCRRLRGQPAMGLEGPG